MGKPDDLMEILASKLAELGELQREQAAKRLTANLVWLLRPPKLRDRKHIMTLPPEEAESAMERSERTAYDSGLTAATWLKVVINAGRELFGDPAIMLENSNTRHHACPYWNPTNHNLLISPLGLTQVVDGKTIPVDRVAPGAMIYIPAPYTLGGKKSAVAGVAPQLRALPVQVDLSLDIYPTTYAEWCTFGQPGMSKCCNKQTVWSDGHRRVMCSKCGARP